MKFYSILAALLLSTLTSIGQCVVINEVMVNAAGACDGSCTPNTGEWIELYNTCPFDWNIECYILSDGDFSITMPAGTIIPGNGFLVVGSSNSGIPVDVNIGTCGCTTGPNAQVGILTNSAEQLLLFDNIGTIIDGIVWGGGQWNQQTSFTTNSFGICPQFTVPILSVFTQIQTVPAQGSNDGLTVFRSCDGVNPWVSGTLPPSPGASNNSDVPVTASFSLSESSVCEGDCVQVTNTSAGNPGLWTWLVNGVADPLLDSIAPAICYTAPGIYTYSLIASNGCSADTLIDGATVNVIPLSTLNVTPDIDGVICDNSPTTFSTTSICSTYQWQMNGVDIAGEISDSYTATADGVYSLTCPNDICIAPSTPVELDYQNFQTELSPTSTVLCIGETQQLTLNIVSDGPAVNNEWTLNGNPLTSGFTSFLGVDMGTYEVTSTNPGGCTYTSTAELISANNNPLITIQNLTQSGCWDGPTILGIDPTYSNIFWYDGSSDFSIELLSNATVSVAALDPNGCDASGTYTLDLPECANLVVPNIFSPTNDSFNETFHLVFAGDGSTTAVANYSIQIFNRWGTLVFESTDPDNNWNGTINGNEAATGVYYYVVNAEYANGESILAPNQRSGWFQLVR
jgi:gliding motility-associated-like protein